MGRRPSLKAHTAKASRCASSNPPAGCTLTAVYFEFDAAGLSDDARGTLAANAECIKTQGKGVQVVGHTDPRGTEEYNLTLSELRCHV